MNQLLKSKPASIIWPFNEHSIHLRQFSATDVISSFCSCISASLRNEQIRQYLWKLLDGRLPDTHPWTLTLLSGLKGCRCEGGMAVRGRKTERTLAWIGDKEAPRGEIATAGPTGALIHERGGFHSAIEKCVWLCECVLCIQAYIFTIIFILMCAKSWQNLKEPTSGSQDFSLFSYIYFLMDLAKVTDLGCDGTYSKIQISLLLLLLLLLLTLLLLLLLLLSRFSHVWLCAAP